MDANHDTPSMTQYGFEPFEAAIALMTTRYISEHVSKAEFGAIINPRVIRLNPAVEEKSAADDNPVAPENPIAPDKLEKHSSKELCLFSYVTRYLRFLRRSESMLSAGGGPIVIATTLQPYPNWRTRKNLTSVKRKGRRKEELNTEISTNSFSLMVTER